MGGVRLRERLRERVTARARPLLPGEIVVVVALLMVYDRLRAVAGVRPAVAIAHGWAILDAEGAVHLRLEPALNAWLTGQGLVRAVAVDYYQYLHVSVALAVLALCYLRRPDVYRPARTALVLTNVIGLAIFAAYPAAPPRLLPHAGFVDSVAVAGFGTGHEPALADQYGAMPSLHLAWASWVAVTGFAIARGRLLRVLFAAHPVLTAVAVVSTANHYLLDVAGGVVLAVLATWASGLLALAARRATGDGPGRTSAPAPGWVQGPSYDGVRAAGSRGSS